MERENYIKELRTRLKGLDKEEIEEAITYCEECFEEIGDSEKALQDLGTPAKFAAQIKADVAIKETKEVHDIQKPRSKTKTVWLILGGICALPIALPLLLIVCVLVIVLGILVVVMLFVGIAIVFACFLGAILNFFASFIYMDNPGQMMLMIGLSLISLGIGILSFVGIVMLNRKVIPSLMKWLSFFYQKHKKKGEVYEEV